MGKGVWQPEFQRHCQQKGRDKTFELGSSLKLIAGKLQFPKDLRAFE